LGNTLPVLFNGLLVLLIDCEPHVEGGWRGFNSSGDDLDSIQWGIAWRTRARSITELGRLFRGFKRTGNPGGLTWLGSGIGLVWGPSGQDPFCWGHVRFPVDCEYGGFGLDGREAALGRAEWRRGHGPGTRRDHRGGAVLDGGGSGLTRLTSELGRRWGCFLGTILPTLLGSVLVVWIFLGMENPEPLCLLNKGTTLRLGQQLPLLSKSFGNFRIVRIWRFLTNLFSLNLTPDHECIHWSFDVIRRMLLCLKINKEKD